MHHSILLTAVLLAASISARPVEVVERAALSYIQAWGPKAGCENVGSMSTETYMYGTLTEEGVTEKCKTACADKDNCVFLYVQAVYPANGFFNCYYADHTLNEAEDLECGKDTTEWGSAKGYDAVGRSKS